jgi:hypothetical protein
VALPGDDIFLILCPLYGTHSGQNYKQIVLVIGYWRLEFLLAGRQVFGVWDLKFGILNDRNYSMMTIEDWKIYYYG